MNRGAPTGLMGGNRRARRSGVIGGRGRRSMDGRAAAGATFGNTAGTDGAGTGGAGAGTGGAPPRGRGARAVGLGGGFPPGRPRVGAIRGRGLVRVAMATSLG